MSTTPPPEYTPPRRGGESEAVSPAAEKSKVFIISLRHCKDGGPLRGSTRTVGRVISRTAFPVTITSSMTLARMIDLLSARVMKDFDINVHDKHIFAGLNVVVGGHNVHVKDVEIWEPCRDLLIEGNEGKPMLNFNFFEVSEKEALNDKRKERKSSCAVQ